MQETNLKLLETIIEDNKNTEYGKKYNFPEIKNINDYKKHVPLNTYEDFEPYIKRMYNGEKNILTAYPIIGYLLTSGSENFIQKDIPVTIKAVKNLGFKPLALRDKIMSKYKKEHNSYILYIANFHIDINKEPPKQFVLSEIAYYYTYKDKIEDFNQYLGGPDLMFDIDTFDYFYEKIWISILVDYIGSIESTYMYSILQFL